MISSCMILQLVDGKVTGQCHRGQEYQPSGAKKSGGPYAHGHQVVNVFYSVGFSICKTIHKMCIRYYYLGT